MSGEVVSAAAAIVGGIVGAVLTFILSQIASSRQDKRKVRTQVLMVLMGGRGRIHARDVTDHVNVIPIAFAGETRVIHAYQHLCAAAAGDFPTMLKRYVELVIVIADIMGFKGIGEADLNLGYFFFANSNTDLSGPPEGR